MELKIRFSIRLHKLVRNYAPQQPYYHVGATIGVVNHVGLINYNQIYVSRFEP
jgi:hypothetical protein